MYFDRLVFAALSILFALSGCGGGADAVSSYQVESGVAQKGALLQGSDITINELSSNTYLQNGKSYSFQTLDNFGSFNTSKVPFSSPYLQTTAQGYYFNELTGAPSSDIVFLRGLSNIETEQDQKINVNILSSFTKNRTLNLLNSSNGSRLNFNDARHQAQRELFQNFYIYNYTDLLSGKVVGGIRQPNSFTTLDLSAQREGDQILAALSGVVMRVIQMGVSLNMFLSEIENDLSNDGILNETSTQSIITATTTLPNLNATSTYDLFCAAFKSTNFNVVATNLNKFYKTNYQPTDLSQWVDSSGCVDKVIDKFKHTSTDSNKQGYISKSQSSYAVTSDDVGQCFTLSNNSELSITGLYLNNSLNAVQNNAKYYIGSAVQASAGDRLTLGITSLVSGVFTVYLQRFAPTGGSCAAIPAVGARINIMKFTLISN